MQQSIQKRGIFFNQKGIIPVLKFRTLLFIRYHVHSSSWLKIIIIDVQQISGTFSLFNTKKLLMEKIIYKCITKHKIPHSKNFLI